MSNMSPSDIGLIIVVIILEVLIVKLFDSFSSGGAGLKITLIIIAIFVDAALILFLSNISEKPAANITAPLEGSIITRQISVIGNYENLDDDANLWVYVYSPSTGEYYFYEAALYYNAHTWDVPNLLVGSDDKSDEGKLFELGVLSANNQASQQLRKGINEIPKGAILVSEKITLRRFGDIATATPKPAATDTPASTEDSVPSNTTPTRTPKSTDIPVKTPTPALGIGSTRIRPTDEAVMVYVPAGEFMMGGDDGHSDEQPIHAVYLDEYWIDQTEVTNGMYAQCVADGDCRLPEVSKSYTRDSYYGNSAFDDYPVIEVSSDDAVAYCEWADGRLPTEAEWEKAASWDDDAQQAQVYPWGDDFDGTQLNFCDSNCSFDHKDGTVDDGYEDTAPVGSYPDGVSPYGALDMAGNVWEWVNDFYDADYYEQQVYDNPTGPSDGSRMVLRGGSWGNVDSYVRAAIRGYYDPAERSDFLGFRCAQE